MFRILKTTEFERYSINKYKLLKKHPIIVVLDNIRSANNVGAIFRTCDAFLIETLYLTGITATPPHKEINKTAIGATESVDWKYSENIIPTIKNLKRQGYLINAVEQTTNSTILKTINKLKVVEKNLVIFGNEVNGVNQNLLNLCDRVLEIEQLGTKHSLNVSISAGIVLWNLTKNL